MSLLVMGSFALATEFDVILERGLWHNVNTSAWVAIVNSAFGGLTVAAVLKFADSVLKVAPCVFNDGYSRWHLVFCGVWVIKVTPCACYE
jgi:hypothetical protein